MRAEDILAHFPPTVCRKVPSRPHVLMETTLTLDDVRSLTRAEIETVFARDLQSREARRYKNALETESLQQGENVISALSELVHVKKRERAAKRRGKRKREDVEPGEDTGRPSRFMVLPSKEEVAESAEKFYNATSNEALRHEICGSCGRRCWGKDMAHPAHELHHGLLCRQCSSALLRDETPPLALANNMWIGAIPFELRILTVPEQMLIALHYPRCFVYKLFPKDGGVRDADKLQSGMVGNVTTYEHNIPEIANMLDGGLLPRRPTILASVIAVAFIGRGKIPRSWLKGTFRVRRKAVGAALEWLKEHNTLYRDIVISLPHLQSLPEDDVPIEITAAFRREENGEIAEHERENYVPMDDDGEQSLTDSGSDALEEGMNMEDECTGDAEGQEPRVIRLQSLGCCDVDLHGLPTTQLMTHALANATSSEEGGYGVIRSGKAVSDFGQPRAGHARAESSRNPLAAAFPCLFPYGVGGIEADRPTRVSFTEHIRWCLEYHDHRFATHHTFPFVAFGMEQKRQALLSARLQMQKKNFDADAEVLSTITVDDVRKAEQQIENHERVSDPRIRMLKKHLFATARRVMGSDEMRASYRSQVWGTSIMLGPPTLWTTWNPCDLHDPIVQIFAGEEIDMDNFDRTAGPDADKRARNVAHDPYAAAKFFHFIITLILRALFGIENSGGSVTSTMGMIGELSGYYGVVEAQGRGTLHLHMLIWLRDAPSADQMHLLLQTEEFRESVKRFIRANIRSHLEGLSTSDELAQCPRGKELAYSRPPNPRAADFEARAAEMERTLARSAQVHTCKTTTCLRPNRKGQITCKRGAPFALSADDFIDCNGKWMSRRLYGYFNAWIPKMMPQVRCNHDAKLITNGNETKDCAWYFTTYSTKKQNRTNNKSALLAQGFVYHSNNSAEYRDIRDRNRLLLFRCFSAVNREQELSGPQVVMYLMGWGDTFTSHQYVPLYWWTLRAALLEAFPQLKMSPSQLERDRNENLLPATSEANVGEGQGGTVNDESNETITIQFSSTGIAQTRSQVQDYALRGREFENMSFLEFLVHTYEERIPAKARTTQDERQNDTDDTPSGNARRRGRPAHIRSRYLPEHPRVSTFWRVKRGAGHNTLPSVVGPYFPRRNDPDISDLYNASMLALLQPWRELRDILTHDSWHNTFEAFTAAATPRVHFILSGIQYYYECADGADKQRKQSQKNVSQCSAECDPEHESEDEEGEDVPTQVLITEAAVDSMAMAAGNTREEYHGRHALELGKLARIFPDHLDVWETGDADTRRTATAEDVMKLQEWQCAMQQRGQQMQAVGGDVGHGEGEQHGLGGEGTVSLLADMTNDNVDERGDIIQHNVSLSVDVLPPVDPSCLLEEQRRAFDIVQWHLRETMLHRAPPQLLMHVAGEGGVGKSKVIQTITELFNQQGAGSALVKAAYTGIAASIIGGSTLHTVAMIPKNGRTQSAATKKKLSAYWCNVSYLIIDEISMVSRPMFALLDRVLANAKGVSGGKNNTPFGGLNVIIFGDLHQFPPVAVRKSAPLFWPANNFRDKEDEIVGRKLYEQFTTVVKLRKQVRVTDAQWLTVLQHARHGNCTETHLKLLRSLILNTPACPHTDFSSAPWKDAVLVTPRHAVRNQWNEAATIRHCAETQRTLYLCHAEDSMKGRALTLQERYDVLKSESAKRKKDRAERVGLPPMVQLAIGMKVMVTFNVHTELDIANGARGFIHDIVLDSREVCEKGASIVRLRYLPTCVLVRLDRFNAMQLDGLPDGVVPITPITKTYSAQIGGVKQTISRRQYPTTGAYAFTDYRAQGQTIPFVIVDIAPPPSGGLTPFNAYVALSRSSGSATIRLLRDFDDKLFTEHPSEFLRAEDARLENLDANTRRDWERFVKARQIAGNI